MLFSLVNVNSVNSERKKKEADPRQHIGEHTKPVSRWIPNIVWKISSAQSRVIYAARYQEKFLDLPPQ
jgi:hypothetical protein